MADYKPVSAAELQRRREQSDNIRLVARGLKALVHRRYPHVAFREMAEDKTSCNIESVSFGPAYACADGTVVPPYAIVEFHIGNEGLVDPQQMEAARQKLEKDLRDVFGSACRDLEHEPTAGSMVFQNRCTGWATVYGPPEALAASLRQAAQGEDFKELRYLLAQERRGQAGRGG